MLISQIETNMPDLLVGLVLFGFFSWLHHYLSQETLLPG